MLNLKLRLAAELPHIECALKAGLERVPEPARPVAQHIFDAGGKRLRPFLTVIFARLLGYTHDDIYELAICMEMLHAATLLHDDILDAAATRRGKITAHQLFGSTRTILAGDALLATANHIVADKQLPALSACFAEATSQTAAGEILEIQYMRKLDQSGEIYTQVVRGKTAWLLRASCVMGALYAHAAPAYVEAAALYGENIGMAFQIVDDALDFASEQITGKPTGGDVREGKLTPPIRMYRESLQGADKAAFDTLFTTGEVSDTAVSDIANSIRTQGFDTATRAMAQKYLDTAHTATARLPQGSEIALLGAMIDYIKSREK